MIEVRYRHVPHQRDNLQDQREEIEQYDDESIVGMIELLIEGKVKREALIEAYLVLWQGAEKGE